MNQLEAIEARLSKATPGEWRAVSRSVSNENDYTYDNGFLGWEIEGPPDSERGQFERGADAVLIAHAPADLTALLAVARAAVEVTTNTGRCVACAGIYEDHADNCPLAPLLREVEP